MASQMKPITLNGHVGVFYGVTDDDPYFMHLVHNDTEPEFGRIVNTVVPHDGICLDIGANIGLKTFILSKHLLEGKVYSVEAAQKVAEILRMNIDTNNLMNVYVEQCAISDYTGNTYFVDNSAWGHLITSENYKNKSCDESVNVYTIIDLFNKYEMSRIDFIKIDTEGNELSILQGGEKILDQFTPWIMLEFNSFCLSAYGDINPLCLLRYIFNHFKYIFRIERDHY